MLMRMELFVGCRIQLWFLFLLHPLQVGGATALIGDPSGKSSDRPLLTRATVDANASGIRECLQSLPLKWDGPCGAQVVNNAEFYDNLSVLDFMREVGTRFRLSSMLNKDSVRSRLGTDEGARGEEGSHGSNGGGVTEAADGAPAPGMSYTEFSYQLFQSYDFWRLHQRWGCTVQVGGADQWGNISAGMDFCRRVSGGRAECAGLTTPLLTDAAGGKFGKSAGNALWLDASRTPARALHEYLMAQPDSLVPSLLRRLTALPEEELRGLESRHAADPGARVAHAALADEVTRLVRGEAGVAAAQAAAALILRTRAGPSTPSPEAPAAGQPAGLSAAQLLALVGAGQLPSVSATLAEALQWEVADAAVRCGASRSKAEARRLAAAGGLYLNAHRVADARQRLTPADFLEGRVALIASGKKNQWALEIKEG